MSKAVPWSTEVLKKGNPNVKDTTLWKSNVFVAICPWSWYKDNTEPYLPIKA